MYQSLDDTKDAMNFVQIFQYIFDQIEKPLLA